MTDMNRDDEGARFSMTWPINLLKIILRDGCF